MTDEQKVREAFEAWASVCGFDLTTIALMPSVYRDADTCHAYDGWQAALAHASSATTTPQESSSRLVDDHVAGVGKLVDARDAARYRYVRSSCGEFVQYAGGGTHHLLEDEELDRAIDQAIAKATAGGEREG